MHAADILAGVHTAFRSPRQAVIMGPRMRGLLPDEAPEPGQPEASTASLPRPRAGLRHGAVYPADQDPGGTPLPAQVSRSYREPQNSGAAQCLRPGR